MVAEAMCWVAGWVACLKLEIKLSQPQLKLKLRLSLAIMSFLVATNVVASRPTDWNGARSCQFNVLTVTVALFCQKFSYLTGLSKGDLIKAVKL